MRLEPLEWRRNFLPPSFFAFSFSCFCSRFSCFISSSFFPRRSNPTEEGGGRAIQYAESSKSLVGKEFDLPVRAIKKSSDMVPRHVKFRQRIYKNEALTVMVHVADLTLKEGDVVPESIAVKSIYYKDATDRSNKEERYSREIFQRAPSAVCHDPLIDSCTDLALNGFFM